MLIVLAFAAPAAWAQRADPKATILQQIALYKQGKWRAMYATYTPRFRRSCGYRRFVSVQTRNRGVTGTSFQLRGIQVRRETPSRAILAYRLVQGGRTVLQVTFRHRDVYTRIGGRWYDELDRVSAC